MIALKDDCVFQRASPGSVGESLGRLSVERMGLDVIGAEEEEDDDEGDDDEVDGDEDEGTTNREATNEGDHDDHDFECDTQRHQWEQREKKKGRLSLSTSSSEGVEASCGGTPGSQRRDLREKTGSGKKKRPEHDNAPLSFELVCFFAFLLFSEYFSLQVC